MKIGKYVEYNGFSVEVDADGCLVVEDETGERYNAGLPDDNENAVEAIEDAIKECAYGIAYELMRRLN